MTKGDAFTSPIEFAIGETLQRFENKGSLSDSDKFIVELLKRSKVIWSSIRINGLETCGKTYNDFVKACEIKRNIMFFSDDEIDKLNKALKIMKVMQEED